MARWMLVFVVAAGCYRVPSEEACTVRCDFLAKASCPSGLTCGLDNVCNAGIQCDQIPRVDAPETDAHETDAPDGCYGTGLVTYCPTILAPSMDIGPAQTIVDVDTGDAGAQCTALVDAGGGIKLCVIAADSLSISGILRATGSRPLVLFGRNAITLTGSIDVSGGGAGTTATGCVATAGRNQGAPGSSAGGGAGGSFAGSGGQGGSANDNMNAAPAIPSPLVQFVRGGCAGGNGGRNYQTTGFGDGGLPGGAVYLLSGGAISILGSINASGTGGAGGKSVMDTMGSSGGGGGGSGGLIFLDATALTLNQTAVLLAHGGGGGGGSSSVDDAGAGGSPSLASPASRPLGGFKTGVESGEGGRGSGGTELYGAVGENATAGSCSGGGGGGGAGAIRYRAGTINDSALVYPPVM